MMVTGGLIEGDSGPRPGGGEGAGGGVLSTRGDQSGTQSRLISYIIKTTLQDAALACKN